MEKQIIAYAVAPNVLQAALNVLGNMPYVQVQNVMQALQQSQPIYSDQVQSGEAPVLPVEVPAPPAANGAKASKASKVAKNVKRH